MTTYSTLLYNHGFPANATRIGREKLISTTTASDTTDVNITSGIDSTYKEYIFRFYDLNPASDARFQVNFSIDGGSNYNVSKTTNYYRLEHAEDDGTTGISYKTNFDVAGTGVQQLSNDIGNDADHSGVGEMHLFNPADTALMKHFYIDWTNADASASPIAWSAKIGGYLNTASAVNAVQFDMSTGNFDGVIKMYGVFGG